MKNAGSFAVGKAAEMAIDAAILGPRPVGSKVVQAVQQTVKESTKTTAGNAVKAVNNKIND